MSTLESFNKMLDGFNPLTDERIEEVLNAIDNPLLWVPNDIVIRIPAGDIRAAFNEILLARSASPADADPAPNHSELLSLLKRYRDETPLGHQPHNIAAEADAAIARAEAQP